MRAFSGVLIHMMCNGLAFTQALADYLHISSPWFCVDVTSDWDICLQLIHIERRKKQKITGMVFPYFSSFFFSIPDHSVLTFFCVCVCYNCAMLKLQVYGCVTGWLDWLLVTAAAAGNLCFDARKIQKHLLTRGRRKPFFFSPHLDEMLSFARWMTSDLDSSFGILLDFKLFTLKRICFRLWFMQPGCSPSF